MLIAALPSSKNSVFYKIFPVLAKEQPAHRFALPAGAGIAAEPKLLLVPGKIPEKNNAAAKLQRGLLKRKLKGLKPDVFLEETLTPEAPPSTEKKESIQGLSGDAFLVWDVRGESKAELITNLKAFSLLKSRQQTGMKLLLWSDDSAGLFKLLPELTSYKYRGDVVAADATQADLQTMINESRGLLSFRSAQDHELLLTAIRAGVPLIVADTAFHEMLFGESALLCQREGAGAQMQLLYKDESARSKLVRAGMARAAVFGFEPMV